LDTRRGRPWSRSLPGGGPGMKPGGNFRRVSGGGVALGMSALNLPRPPRSAIMRSMSDMDCSMGSLLRPWSAGGFVSRVAPRLKKGSSKGSPKESLKGLLKGSLKGSFPVGRVGNVDVFLRFRLGDGALRSVSRGRFVLWGLSSRGWRCRSWVRSLSRLGDTSRTL
jgi:hypothetical protein